MKKKRSSGFNILRGDSTTHGGYYTGTLNLSDLSAVLIDGDEAKIDLGLLHGKSAAERRIKFVSNKDEVPDGKDYWAVWVSVDRNEQGPYYAAAAACYLLVDREAKRGWKNMAEHVNRMDDALKRKNRLDDLGQRERKALKELLMDNDEAMWNNSPDELKQLLEEEK